MSVYMSDYFTTGRGRPMAHKGTGARSRRIERIRKATSIVDELAGHGQELDDVFWARRTGRDEDDWMWLDLPISQNDRGGDPLAESNFAVAEKLINEVSAFGTSSRYDAWPGGVIETLRVRADDALALREVSEIISALQGYPILDDDDHSEREWEENHPSDSECYAEDCGCEAAERQKLVEEHEKGGEELHVEIIASGTTIPEFDDDGSWWCEACQNWFWFDADQMAAIELAMEPIRYRQACQDREQKGQLSAF